MKTLLTLLVLLNCLIANAQYFTGTVQYKVDKFKNFELGRKETPNVVLLVSENTLLIKMQYIKTNTSGSQFYIDLVTKKMYIIRAFDSTYSEYQLGDFTKQAKVDSVFNREKILGYNTNLYNITSKTGNAALFLSPEILIYSTANKSNKKVIPGYVPLKVNMILKTTLVDSMEMGLTATSLKKETNLDLSNYMQPYFAKAARKKTADSLKQLGETKTYDEPTIIYTTVEVSENLPGGFNAFVKKNSNIKSYDCSCKVGFWVEKDGSIVDPKIESTNCKKEKYKKEALRLVTISSGRWVPYVRNGSPQKVYRTETISFK